MTDDEIATLARLNAGKVCLTLYGSGILVGYGLGGFLVTLDKARGPKTDYDTVEKKVEAKYTVILSWVGGKDCTHVPANSFFEVCPSAVREGTLGENWWRSPDMRRWEAWDEETETRLVREIGGRRVTVPKLSGTWYVSRAMFRFSVVPKRRDGYFLVLSREPEIPPEKLARPPTGEWKIVLPGGIRQGGWISCPERFFLWEIELAPPACVLPPVGLSIPDRTMVRLQKDAISSLEEQNRELRAEVDRLRTRVGERRRNGPVNVLPPTTCSECKKPVVRLLVEGGDPRFSRLEVD